MEVVANKEKRTVREIHSYACQASAFEECVSSPNTPTKPQMKKARGNEEQPSLLELQDTIISAVIDKINERADQTDKAVHYNTVQIDGLKKSLDFCHKEVADLKKQNSILKASCETLQRKVCEMETKVNESDRYSRRQNLRLHGIPEREDDNLKSRVQEVCRPVLSASEVGAVMEAIDIVHRIGRRKDGNSNQQPRPVIIRFMSRTARDLIWRASKKSEFLSSKKLHFKEDLTAEDRAIRGRLWPTIEAARKRGEKAYFVGIRAFVNGNEIKDT